MYLNYKRFLNKTNQIIRIIRIRKFFRILILFLQLVISQIWVLKVEAVGGLIARLECIRVSVAETHDRERMGRLALASLFSLEWVPVVRAVRRLLQVAQPVNFKLWRPILNFRESSRMFQNYCFVVKQILLASPPLFLCNLPLDPIINYVLPLTFECSIYMLMLLTWNLSENFFVKLSLIQNSNMKITFSLLRNLNSEIQLNFLI